MNSEPDNRIKKNLLDLYKFNKIGQLEEKIFHLQNQFPKSVFLLNLLGIININTEKYDGAISNFEKILKINPSFADAYYNLGYVLKKKKQENEAITKYNKCIELDKNNFQAYNNLGNIYRDKGDIKQAIDNYLCCLNINKNYKIALQNFGICLQSHKFSKSNKLIDQTINNLLNEDKIVRPVDIIKSIISYIYLDKDIRFILENLDTIENYYSIEVLIDKIANKDILITLLKVTPITDLKFEKLIKYLRSKILVNLYSLNKKKIALRLMIAIASQCYINEYIYSFEHQKKLLVKLEKKLTDKFNKRTIRDYVLDLACFASFKPLGSLNFSEQIGKINSLIELNKQQIIEPNKELELKEYFSLNNINNTVSKKVKEQYESNPYPRWNKIALNKNPLRTIDFMEKLELDIKTNNIKEWQNLNVLVAGCGTGQHAITTATKFKNSYITAIDLSSKSLCYAKRKAEELEISNIDFIQMDLLNIRDLKIKFHIIESVGVLHHMEDPFIGWSKLCEVLKKDGLMMIGLYSKLARQHINKIRNKIKKLDLIINNNNIKEFRNNIIKSKDEEYKLIKESTDFYSLSSLRDLLFHTQEHRFDINDIQINLKKLDLKFCGFQNREIINFYKEYHSNKFDLYNLDKWAKFEAKNPRMFAGMYQFWCQKKYN